jgi:phosphoglycerate dehydrogenase-like enzyme
VNVCTIDPLPPSAVEAVRSRLPTEHTLAVATRSDEDARDRRLAHADILLVVHARVNAAALAFAPRLRFVQRH